MTEQAPHEALEYWHTDAGIGRLQLWGETYELFLRTHAATRPYQPSAQAELVPLAESGLCTALTGQAYLLEPRSSPLEHWRRLTGQPLPARSRELDMVRVGDVQAAWYDRDRTLVLWDCGLLSPYAEAEPALDPNLRALWQGAEAALAARFPAATRLVTPSWTPQYDPQEYREFLWHAGYERLSAYAFVKPLIAPIASAR